MAKWNNNFALIAAISWIFLLIVAFECLPLCRRRVEGGSVIGRPIRNERCQNTRRWKARDEAPETRARGGWGWIARGCICEGYPRNSPGCTSPSSFAKCADNGQPLPRVSRKEALFSWSGRQRKFLNPGNSAGRVDGETPTSCSRDPGGRWFLYPAIIDRQVAFVCLQTVS